MSRYSAHDLFHRWEGNPILRLEDLPFRANSVFNGTPVICNGEYLLLVRVEGQQGYSFFALARSGDGYRFSVDTEPALLPADSGPFAKYESHGIEDPRSTFIDGAHHIMYTATSEYGYRIALAKTEDFRHFERIGIVSGPGNKDGVLFPGKIKGMFVRLDRPIGMGVGSIWISYSKDLIRWGGSKPVISPRPGYWDSYRVGASAPPIRTEHGWLEIYHGSKMTSSGPIYRVGAIILDLEDPSRVLARCNVPLLSPREPYERIGDVPNVVFACGALLESDRQVKLYYGGADTCICAATADLDDIVSYTLDGST